MTEEEKRDFEGIITRNGYSISEFSPLVMDDPPPSGADIFLVTGKAIIRRTSSGKERSYQTGHGSEWLSDFERDLREGVFDA